MSFKGAKRITTIGELDELREAKRLKISEKQAGLDETMEPSQELGNLAFSVSSGWVYHLQGKNGEHIAHFEAQKGSALTFGLGLYRTATDKIYITFDSGNKSFSPKFSDYYGRYRVA